MALFNKAKTLTAVALAATAFTALPAIASANDYRCEKKNDEAQVIGGVIGAVLGGVVGSEVAARGNGNEGAFLGAALGAAAGAGLGDESVKCRREQGNNNYRTADYGYDNGYQPAIVNVAHRGRGNRNYRHNNRHYNSYGNIDRQIAALRAERDRLKRRNRYDRSRWIDRRIRQVGRELDQLKDIRRNGRHYSHRNDYRRGHYHGNSRNLCYSHH
ncbi:hypothetical protein [Litorimonas haliclonae]|uniref:hypothetical protein n=1 Tax=Litorimonas haliclonae TaxID=2081977 RepID=UPI0039EEBED0